MQKKTLVFCVIYPGLPQTFIVDYVQSIVNQTDTEFDWLVVNDSSGNDQVRLFPGNVTWINLDTALSFGKIREIGISYAIEHGYDYIMFSDIDDFYSENRVALSKVYLEENDFVFTELQIINVDKRLTRKNYLSNLNINPSPSAIDAILDSNYIGLSHSAVRTTAFLKFEMPDNIEVVDWWIFSLLLIAQHKGSFIPTSDTFYRQSDDNYVGVYNLLTLRRLLRGIDVKCNHYGNLRDYCRKHKPGMAHVFAKKYQEMILLKDRIRDEQFAERYIEVINANYKDIYKGWWSEIVPLERWEGYGQ